MTIFGKPYSEYLRFQGWFLAIVAIVGIARLCLSMAGVSTSIDKFLSVTAVGLIGIVAFAVMVHTSGFGSYRQLLVVYFNNWALANLIVILGIFLAIQTGHDNIYTLPEFSGNQDGKNYLHIVGHLVVGFILLPLASWLIGSLLLFVAKKAGAKASA